MYGMAWYGRKNQTGRWQSYQQYINNNAATMPPAANNAQASQQTNSDDTEYTEHKYSTAFK